MEARIYNTVQYMKVSWLVLTKFEKQKVRINSLNGKDLK